MVLLNWVFHKLFRFGDYENLKLVDPNLITEEEEKLTLQEKWFLIDREIRLLHQFCLKKGYSSKEIQLRAEPLLQPIREAKRNNLLKKFYLLAFLVAVGAALFYCDPVYQFGRAVARIGSLQLLPYWDWTRLGKKDCIIYNPYYEPEKLDPTDCQLCADLSSVQRLSNINFSFVLDNFVNTEKPFIVTDDAENWPAYSDISLNFLHSMYSSDTNLKDFEGCAFTTNVKKMVGTHWHLLDKASDYKFKDWLGYWENCDRPAAKVIRQLMRRPYFLPAGIELSETNWIIIANNYLGKRYQELGVGHAVQYMTQLRGQLQVMLIPKQPCYVTCKKIYVTLNPGETLFTFDALWMVDFFPIQGGEVIAIAAGASFD